MTSPQQTLTDRIDEIARLYPWSEVCDAWSHPLWVPEALHALASDKPFRRLRARCQIYEHVFHQGTPCTGTGAVIVLLVNLAAIKEVPDRALLMRLAGEMLYVDEDRVVPGPLELAGRHPFSSSDVCFRRNVELTWREVTRVIDLLQTLALTESIEIAWWAARILLRGHSRRPCFPLLDTKSWPRLSANVLRQLSAVVERSNSNQLPTEADAAAEYGLDEERDPADSMTDVLLHGAPETIPDIRKVTTLSGPRLYDFLESLELRTLAWSDEAFVTSLLDLIRTRATDGAGEPLHDVLTVLLAHARVHCSEALERLLAFALTHERTSFRSAAARALTAPIDGPAEARVDALIRVLAEGDLAAKLGVLQSGLGCSTGTDWMVPWTQERDPERKYDLPHLRNRMLPSIIACVGDAHRAVRGAAIQALSVVAPDEPEAVARVIERRSDPCPVVRRTVAHFCGSSRLQERTFGVLVDLRSDADPEVRAEAIMHMGLAKVTGPHAEACRRCAVEALDDPDPRVVAWAAWTVQKPLEGPDRLSEKQALARQLAGSVAPDSPAMNVIYKGTLIGRLDESLAAEGEALVQSVASRRPEWMS
jgi:hypothetical protein